MPTKKQLELELDEIYKDYNKVLREKERYEDILYLIQDELYGEVYRCHFNELIFKLKQLKLKHKIN